MDFQEGLRHANRSLCCTWARSVSSKALPYSLSHFLSLPLFLFVEYAEINIFFERLEASGCPERVTILQISRGSERATLKCVNGSRGYTARCQLSHISENLDKCHLSFGPRRSTEHRRECVERATLCAAAKVVAAAAAAASSHNYRVSEQSNYGPIKVLI